MSLNKYKKASSQKNVGIPKYLWQPQGQMLNNIPTTFIQDGIEVDVVADHAILRRGDFTLYINQYSSLTVKELRASFHRMFSIILIKFSERLDPEKTVKISLRDYMKICDLDNVKEARIQLKTDLGILYKSSVSYQSPIKRNNCSEMRLCQDFTIKNSVIYVTLGDKFYDMLLSKDMKRMLIPVLVLQSNLRKNPNSYFIGRKLSEYDRINFNKKHNNVISIKSLLNVCPNLKNWQNSKQKKRDIVQSFERDIDFLEEQIGWEYCKAKGKPLNDEDIDLITDCDFDTFINLYIKYTFTKDYLDLMNTHIKPINTKAIQRNLRKKS